MRLGREAGPAWEVAADIHGWQGGSRHDDVGVVFVDVVVVDVGVAISEDGVCGDD